jgi:hypothetical protein
MIERQIRAALDESKFHCLKFRTNGRCPSNPKNQDAATVDFRIFAQARNEDDISSKKFFRPVSDAIMQSYPGATFAVDARQAMPKPYYEYWVALLPQSAIKHTCHIPSKGLVLPIEAPTDTEDFLYRQASYEPTNPVEIDIFGPATVAPLGYVVHARSGDKGSDCNVGFYTRSAEEWDWLRSLLSIEKVKELLGEDYNGKEICRFELPHIWGKFHTSHDITHTTTH